MPQASSRPARQNRVERDCSGTSLQAAVSDRLYGDGDGRSRIGTNMNHRIALLLAALPLALAGCMNGATTERPRLLADDQARIGNLEWLEMHGAALDQPLRMVNVTLTSCEQAPQADSRPRLVIGEPVCVLGSNRAPRVD